MKICATSAKKDVGLMRNLRRFGHIRSVIPARPLDYFLFPGTNRLFFTENTPGTPFA